MTSRRPLHVLSVAALFIVLTACGESSAPRLPPLPPEGVVLALGDSLTYGTGAPRSASYPAVLAQLTGRRVVNAGVPGEESRGGRQRLPGLLQQYRPALLILAHGGNDLLRRKDRGVLRENLVAMIRAAQAAGTPVLLMGVPEPTLFLLEAASVYEAVARETGVPLEAEVLPDVLSDNRLKSDPIHPNAAGYRRIATALASFLREAGALP